MKRTAQVRIYALNPCIHIKSYEFEYELLSEFFDHAKELEDTYEEVFVGPGNILVIANK